MKIKHLIKAAMSIFAPPNNVETHNQKQRQTTDSKNIGSLGPNFYQCNIGDIECFINLIMEDEIIQQFLEFDRCYKLADKYLISLTFVYFVRARLDHSRYTRINFFAALYLAHDIEEDDESLKVHIARWGLPRLQKNNLDYFLAVRDSLWMSMDLRACVSVECCVQVMKSMENCPLWKRERSSAHSGAFRSYMPDEECGNCLLESKLFNETDYEYEDSEEGKCCDDEDDIILPPPKRLRLN